MKTIVAAYVAVIGATFATVSGAQPPESGTTIRVIPTAEGPALVGLVRRTLEAHPRVLAAQAEVSSRTSLAQAADRPIFNPEVGLDIESSGTNDRVLTFSQTLDVAGQRDARAAVASSERRVAELGLARVRRDLSVELLSALAAYWTARDFNDLSGVRVDLMERFVDVTGQRQRAGDLTQVDFNVANLAYAQARIERASAAAELAVSEQQLEALVPGGGISSWPSLPVDLPIFQPSEPEILSLVEAVPDVRVQSERVAVAEADVRLRDRERRATPTLGVFGGEEENDSLVGISFSMPLNVRNRFRYEVSAAMAAREQANRELDSARLRARANLVASINRYSLVRAAWVQWRDAGAASLAEQAELIERLWRAGDLGVTDYLVQLDQTLDAQASAIQLRSRLWGAWLESLATSGQVGVWLGLPIEDRTL